MNQPVELSARIINDLRQFGCKATKALPLLQIVTNTDDDASQYSAIKATKASYRTGVGEQKNLSLTEGSHVDINTDTSVDIDFTESRRTLKLRHGDIIITTINAAHPFIVHTRHGQIAAFGSRFQVRTDADQTHVMVYEHAVSVMPVQSKSALTLQAGQQVIVDAERHSPLTSVPAHTDSWSKGVLIVNDWSLSQFINELKRYHCGSLNCDQAVANLRIHGAFQLHDTQAVLRTLAATLPIKIRGYTRFWTTVEAA